VSERVEAGGGEASQRLKLSDAARRLGCHVETLRIRIRKRELEASRGPHGAYYVTVAALEKMPAIERHQQPRSFTGEELEYSWKAFKELLIADRGPQPELLALVDEIRAEPARNLVVHRLLSVHRLLLTDLSFEEIALHLGISSRHARRLARRRPLMALRWLRMERRRRKQLTRARARAIVDELQQSLEAGGFRGHMQPLRGMAKIVTKRDSAPAFPVRRLTRYEQRQLRQGGLSEEQLEAIQLVGLGADELHELMNRSP
jgi:hypothetical protein